MTKDSLLNPVVTGPKPIYDVEIVIRRRRSSIPDLTGGYATYADPKNRQWLWLAILERLQMTVIFAVIFVSIGLLLGRGCGKW